MLPSAASNPEWLVARPSRGMPGAACYSVFVQVKVVYFGILRDFSGAQQEMLEVAEGASTGDALVQLKSRHPQIERFSQSIAIAVNLEYSNLKQVLHEGDELALIPPVSGGLARCAIVREPIRSDEISNHLRAGEDGAVIVFDGIVRNNTRGRKTLYLDYEAYEPMALKEMESLCDQALRDYKIRDVRIVHRVGHLEIGETSVVIVVASAHRGAAFDACRFLIDTLKKKVPVWKKEYFEDGAVWADGESFPADVPTT